MFSPSTHGWFSESTIDTLSKQQAKLIHYAFAFRPCHILFVFLFHVCLQCYTVQNVTGPLTSEFTKNKGGGISKTVKKEEQKCQGTTQLSIILITKHFRHYIALCNPELQQSPFMKFSGCWTRPVYHNSNTQEKTSLTFYSVAQIFIFLFFRSGRCLTHRCIFNTYLRVESGFSA